MIDVLIRFVDSLSISMELEPGETMILNSLPNNTSIAMMIQHE